MLKACSRCGRVHAYNYNCTHNKGRKYSDTEENKLRGRYSWKQKRESIKDRANYICEVCRALGDFTPRDLEVHHITKLRDDPNGLLEDDNLIALCITHHKQADRGELDPDYLRDLARKRDEK